MKKFESITEALREVKSMSSEMDKFDSIFLVYNNYHENYLVSVDDCEIEELIEQRWIDSACELKPEEEAEEYKVWEYYLEENKEKWPNAFRSFKKSLIKSENPLVRRAKQVEPEYSVTFSIQ